MKASKLSDVNKVLEKEYLTENGFKYALVYNLNSVKLIVLGNREPGINRDILLEARFFNEEKELHIYREGDLKAVLIEKSKEDVENVNYFIEQQALRKEGKMLVLINYLDYDDDGQAYIKATCLCDAVI